MPLLASPAIGGKGAIVGDAGKSRSFKVYQTFKQHNQGTRRCSPLKEKQNTCILRVKPANVLR
jgi:hypothetical protein